MILQLVKRARGRELAVDETRINLEAEDGGARRLKD